jgi:aldehyde:ferredoxin oxidoreductase
MISREGIGDLLADGVKVAAGKIGKGSIEFAIQAGGQEPAMHDGRNDRDSMFITVWSRLRAVTRWALICIMKCFSFGNV